MIGAEDAPEGSRSRPARAGATIRHDILQTWKADFFKALAHPARIKILEHLRGGEKSAGEILEAFFFSSRRRHTRSLRDWSSDVCSSDLPSTRTSTVTRWRSTCRSRPKRR